MEFKETIKQKIAEIAASINKLEVMDDSAYDFEYLSGLLDAYRDVLDMLEA
ncbi:hypothetical protein [Pseudolactococcus insecticola]|uniref:Uncharacterized protein n=1 Tax=Pseudolactococcus insecticola TaxID=2709158 RepID=A0A6A0B832_9LACT|nr:hypothetical protein [Lactococcus insecticola]GFH40823.1 hypothetical protein Hs20B_12210 [Lactococcus insecticola]